MAHYIATIAVDLDSVLIDFERGFYDITGYSCEAYSKRYGRSAFWTKIRRVPNFYRNLRPMPDAHVLWNAIKHLLPEILTGCQNVSTDGPQKRESVAEHFGREIPVHTCLSREKRLYARHGLILIDDRAQNCLEWSDAGGVAIQHISATETISQLRQLGILK